MLIIFIAVRVAPKLAPVSFALNSGVANVAEGLSDIF